VGFEKPKSYLVGHLWLLKKKLNESQKSVKAGVRCFWICTTRKAAFGQKHLWLLGSLVGFWLLQKQKQVQKPNQRDPQILCHYLGPGGHPRPLIPSPYSVVNTALIHVTPTSTYLSQKCSIPCAICYHIFVIRVM